MGFNFSLGHSEGSFSSIIKRLDVFCNTNWAHSKKDDKIGFMRNKLNRLCIKGVEFLRDKSGYVKLV